jgi:hypothetical protein
VGEGLVRIVDPQRLTWLFGSRQLAELPQLPKPRERAAKLDKRHNAAGKHRQRAQRGPIDGRSNRLRRAGAAPAAGGRAAYVDASGGAPEGLTTAKPVFMQRAAGEEEAVGASAALALREAEALESRLAVPTVLFFFLPFMFLILVPLLLPVINAL